MRQPFEAYHGGLAARYAAAVSPLIEGRRSYALVDYPHHNNVGDVAMYLGQMAFLRKRFGRPPGYIATTYDDNRGIDDHLTEDGVILIQGGGNFGDIYDIHQRLLCDLLARYPHRRIVQLPQSIHYRDWAKSDAVARQIEAHPDFHLLVRDEPSRADAEAHFQCPVATSPDAAHCLGVLVPSGTPDTEFFSLVREDVESSSELGTADLKRHGGVADWGKTGLRTSDRAIAKALRTAAVTRSMRMYARFYYLDRLARRRLEAGIALLSSGRHVITDRLHGSIISTLLCKSHIALDNSYGKLSRYYGLWGAPPASNFATTVAEIDRFVEEIRTREGITA